jgi:hypothetical protein
VGDTHRHTDISQCNNGGDGSLQDGYRYALDAYRLDWLAISDHDQDILKHRSDKIQRPRQDYAWWRSQKYCDLYSIPGRFLALYGYEHGGSYQARGGHKNVISDQRGLPVREEDSPEELFRVLANSGCIAIPHQLADAGSRMDWDKWNKDYERVAEIFQARRLLRTGKRTATVLVNSLAFNVEVCAFSGQLLLELADGEQVECVWMNNRGGHDATSCPPQFHTFCISSRRCLS